MYPGSCNTLDIIDRHSRQHSQLERDRELSRCFFGRICWTNQRKAKILSTKRKKGNARKACRRLVVVSSRMSRPTLNLLPVWKMSRDVRKLRENAATPSKSR